MTTLHGPSGASRCTSIPALRMMAAVTMLATMTLAACSSVPKTPATIAASDAGTQPPVVPAVQSVASTQPATPIQEEARPSEGVAPASDGLGELDAMTFGCPKAGLNAAAREAANAPTQGHYQFAYFRIVRDSHHSAYEVHFKSNYHGEPDLKYCVSLYCQQGWDQKNSKVSVSLIGSKPTPAGAHHVAAGHGAGCEDQRMRGSGRAKR